MGDVVPLVKPSTTKVERKINVSMDEIKALIRAREAMEISECSQVQCWTWMDQAEQILREFAGE